jgi:hypothetical protein
MNRWILVGLSLILLFLQPTVAISAEKRSKGVRTIHLNDMTIASIFVHPDGVVLNFPTKPDVHVGKKGAFNIVYAENDIVISAAAPGAKMNIFIYLLGRRYTLKLIAAQAGGDEIVSIRDPSDQKFHVEVK